MSYLIYESELRYDGLGKDSGITRKGFRVTRDQHGDERKYKLRWLPVTRNNNNNNIICLLSFGVDETND